MSHTKATSFLSRAQVINPPTESDAAVVVVVVEDFSLKPSETRSSDSVSPQQKSELANLRTPVEEKLYQELNYTSSSGDPDYFPYNYLINEEDACSDQPVIINIVLVAANDIKSRLRIRELWGNPTYKNVTGMKTVFLLGTTNTKKVQTNIARESQVYHDIIQMDFTDCYKILALKTLSLLHWVKTFCPSARWVLKSDVDILVNPFQLRHFLESRDEDFVCIIHPKPRVCRKVSKYCPTKWIIPRDVFDRDVYPPYCRGPAYVMRTGMAPLLFWSANKTHPFIMEDVYYTGILAEPMRLRYFNLEGDKFPFFEKDVHQWLESLSFLLLNIEGLNKREPPVLWNKLLGVNGLPRQDFRNRSVF
ncbi:beta-1,3-galactosyltransferase 1-like [Palaemon carinicauda]|uniref:beta-1,3-galactosyltransferase 1-like n=1 Tax=Palaemon carinicauda TaxID=392227 RepID=UPI0035B60641